jgi:hypothetical protein
MCYKLTEESYFLDFYIMFTHLLWTISLYYFYFMKVFLVGSLIPQSSRGAKADASSKNKASWNVVLRSGTDISIHFVKILWPSGICLNLCHLKQSLLQGLLCYMRLSGDSQVYVGSWCYQELARVIAGARVSCKSGAPYLVWRWGVHTL